MLVKKKLWIALYIVGRPSGGENEDDDGVVVVVVFVTKHWIAVNVLNVDLSHFNTAM